MSAFDPRPVEAALFSHVGDHKPAAGLPVVFFDWEAEGAPLGRVLMELRADICPLTAENFRCLCTGERGAAKSGAALHYKKSRVHRVVPGLLIQGGDFQRGNGTGGESIYGMKFRDENFALKHDGPGVLSMANGGPHTNGSQFCLSTAAAPWLDGKHVAFGRVVRGFDVLRKVEALASPDGNLTRPVTIAECGQIA